MNQEKLVEATKNISGYTCGTLKEVQCTLFYMMSLYNRNILMYAECAHIYLHHTAAYEANSALGARVIYRATLVFFIGEKEDWSGLIVMCH